MKPKWIMDQDADLENFGTAWEFQHYKSVDFF